MVELSSVSSGTGREERAARAKIEFAGDPWLVWSNFHRAWFADPGFVMHPKVAGAFRFSLADAKHLVAACNEEMNEGPVDRAVAVSLIDAITKTEIEGVRW